MKRIPIPRNIALSIAVVLFVGLLYGALLVGLSYIGINTPAWLAFLIGVPIGSLTMLILSCKRRMYTIEY